MSSYNNINNNSIDDSYSPSYVENNYNNRNFASINNSSTDDDISFNESDLYNSNLKSSETSSDNTTTTNATTTTTKTHIIKPTNHSTTPSSTYNTATTTIIETISRSTSDNVYTSYDSNNISSSDSFNANSGVDQSSPLPYISIILIILTSFVFCAIIFVHKRKSNYQKKMHKRNSNNQRKVNNINSNNQRRINNIKSYPQEKIYNIEALKTREEDVSMIINSYMYGKQTGINVCEISNGVMNTYKDIMAYKREEVLNNNSENYNSSKTISLINNSKDILIDIDKY